MFERPTFSERWYRVAGLRVRLRASVRVHRQRYRGASWWVVEDPVANRFFRMSRGAYAFVGLLDGERTVEEAWRACNERVGDEAPTQDEVIRVLGELHVSNLLRGEVTGDARALFERHRTRVRREMMGKAASFLFVKVPLLDPDRFLTAWAPIVGRLFTPVGFALWLVLIGLGLAAIVREWDALVRGAGSVLAPGNLGWMLLAFVVVKLLHELGHGFACKWFGMREGGGGRGGGEVHAMGVMILVLMPVPYVDASSAWALASKWRRIVVGAAGMMVELGVAAVAAMVWAGASEGIVRALAYNVVFIAGVSTILFNGNPLLRYDGYYILADWLEIPNLAQRSKEQVYWVVKRFAWGMREARVLGGAGRSTLESWLLGVYGIASGLYRVFVAWIIVVFVSGQLFFLGVLMAIGAVVLMLGVPAGKLVAYLWTSPEPARVRGRAIGTTLAAVAAAIVLVGAVPLPDRVVVEGVVEAGARAGVFAGADGFVARATQDGTPVDEGAALLESESAELRAERDAARAALRAAESRYRMALAADAATARIRAEEIDALRERLASIERRMEGLAVAAPVGGVWVCAACDRLEGRYLRRGARIGEVVDLDGKRVTAVVGQSVAAAIVAEGGSRVEVRARGRDGVIEGSAGEPSPAGRRDLASAALADVAGGQTVTEQGAGGGRRAREGLFEVPVSLGRDGETLRVGQRVRVRFDLERKPVGVQIVRGVRRVFQGRRRIE